MRFIVCLSFLLGICAPLFSQQENDRNNCAREQDLLKQYHGNFASLSKKKRIAVLTDLGKLYFDKEDYLSALSYLLQAKKINRGDSLQYSGYNNVFGKIFLELQAYSTALRYFKEEIDTSSYRFGNIGVVYLKLNQVDSAEFYFAQQLEESKKSKNYVGQAVTLNNIGMAKMRRKDVSKALPYLFEALEILDKQNSKESLEEIISMNIGRVYYKLKKYAEALQYTEAYFKKYKDKEQMQVLCPRMYHSYLKTNQPGKAQQVLSDFKAGMDTDNSRDLICLKRMQLYFSLYRDDKKQSKLLAEDLEDLQLHLEWEAGIEADKANKILSYFLMAQAKEKIALERSHQKKKISLEKREQALVNFIWFFVLLVLLVIGFFYYQFTKSRQKKNELERQRILLEDEKLKHKIKLQENFLTDFAIEKKINHTVSMDLIKKLKDIKSYDYDQVKKEIDELIMNLRSKEQLTKDVENLNIQSDSLFINYRIVLRELHPNLTETEIDLCLLTKLNMGNKGIALYKNVSVNTVKVAKNRLKKKMQINSEMSLNDYLDSIL